ncbi:MAG: amidohydrolase [Lachnospiraceae bacterium]|nr:amidohydrolase [Lachnospiraceae bacterium]
MKIIDAHAHIFPTKIAFKASESIGDFYGIPMNSDASVESLLKLEGELGASNALVCSSALSPAQVESINNFIAGEVSKHPMLIGLAAMHKDYENFEEEILRAKSLGLRGFKFHNDMQRFDIDDPKMFPIYKAIAEAGMVVLFHMGDDRYDFSAPEKMVKVAQTFPNLTVIGAHFGGYRRWSDSIHNPKLDNVYYDTSSSLFMIDTATAERFIDHFGPERFFFGSDFPMWDPKKEYERFNKLNLSEEVREMILYKNFAKVFNLDI